MQVLQLPVLATIQDMPRILYNILLFDSLCQNKDKFCLNEPMQQKMNIGVNVPRTYTYKPIA